MKLSMKQNHVHGEQAGVAKAEGEGKGAEGDGWSGSLGLANVSVYIQNG